MTKNKIQVGDDVRIIQNKSPLQLGETWYRVKSIDGFNCMIAEVFETDVVAAAQKPFDLSLLYKVGEGANRYKRTK